MAHFLLLSPQSVIWSFLKLSRGSTTSGKRNKFWTSLQRGLTGSFKNYLQRGEGELIKTTSPVCVKFTENCTFQYLGPLARSVSQFAWSVSGSFEGFLLWRVLPLPIPCLSPSSDTGIFSFFHFHAQCGLYETHQSLPKPFCTASHLVCDRVLASWSSSQN